MAGTGSAHLRPVDETVLRVENLEVTYANRGKPVYAVSGVSLDIAPGETLALVGESGCGKSSTVRAVMQLPPPTSGSVHFRGRDLTQLSGRPLREARSKLQIILQDPLSALNPRRRVRDAVAESLVIWKIDDANRVTEALDAVGLSPEVSDRRPHELSGGQCQRVCIARSLAARPDVLILDEPVSALDVSVQGQIINLLEDLREQYQLSMLFVSHDLGVVKAVSDRVAVMYLGRLCELANPDELFSQPRHPYTAGLLAAVPRPDPSVKPVRDPIPGELPSPMAPPSGCVFRTRCRRATDVCALEVPQMASAGDNRWVACHNPLPTETNAGMPDSKGRAA